MKIKKGPNSSIEELVQNTDMYIFDLNKTIADIEGPATDKIILELTRISKKKRIVVTSGQDYKRLKESFLNYLPRDFNLENLSFIPTNGTEVIDFDENGNTNSIFVNSYKNQEIDYISSRLRETIEGFNTKSKLSFNNNWYIDYRYDHKNKEITQITFKGIKEDEYDDKEKLNQDKKAWDKDGSRRTEIINILKEKLGEEAKNYNISIGGSTSIDITKKTETGEDIDKGFGITKLAENLGISLDKITYIGDDMKNNDNFALSLDDITAIEVDGKVSNTPIKISDTTLLVKHIAGLLFSEDLEKAREAKIIISDLDETLVKSKSKMEKDQAQIIINLLEQGKVFYIITGGKFETIEENVINPISELLDENELEILKNLKIAALTGSEIYEYQDGNYELKRELSEFNFEEKEYTEIQEKLNNILENLYKDTNYGKEIEKVLNEEKKLELLENRGKQITYSVFGQKASTETKKKLKKIEKKYNIDWRNEIMELFLKENDNYILKSAGSTSIDFTKEVNGTQLNKGTGYNLIIENEENPNKEKILGIGDKNHIGGNDYALGKEVLGNGGVFIDVFNEHEGKYFLDLLRK